MNKYLVVLLISFFTIVNVVAKDGETSKKEFHVKKEMVNAVKVNDLWHEGNVLSTTDTSISFSMNVVIYEKLDSTNEESLFATSTVDSTYEDSLFATSIVDSTNEDSLFATSTIESTNELSLSIRDINSRFYK